MSFMDIVLVMGLSVFALVIFVITINACQAVYEELRKEIKNK